MSEIVSKWFKIYYENNVTANGVTIQSGTTVERTALGLTLTAADKGYYCFFDETEGRPYWWYGTKWV